MHVESNSRAGEFPSGSSLSHLVIVLICRCAREMLLGWWGRWVTLRARGASIHIIWISRGSGVLIVSPLLIGLMRLLVVIAAIRIVRRIVVRAIVLSIGVTAIPLVELVTVLLLLLRGTSVLILGIRITML